MDWFLYDKDLRHERVEPYPTDVSLNCNTFQHYMRQSIQE